MRKLSELRVTDLRSELEGRGLDKTGVKATLIERIKNALKDDGYDPEEYDFDNPNGTNNYAAEVEEEAFGDTEARNEDDTEAGNEDVTEADNDDNTPADNDEPGDDDMKAEDDDIEAGDDGEEVSEITNTVGELLEEEEAEVSESALVDYNSVKSETKEQETKEVKVGINQETVKNESCENNEEKNKNLEDGNEGKEETLKEIKSQKDVESSDVLLHDYEGLDVFYEDDELLYDDGNESHDEEGNARRKKTHSKSSSDSAHKKDSSDTSISKTEGDKAKSDNNVDDKSDSKSDKDKKTSVDSDINLWVSGLEKSTKAQDLKALFTKHGKVVSVKIVMNAKAAGSRCFGFVTMQSKEDAAKCITLLNQSQLNGKTITVEKSPVKVKNDNTKKDIFKKAEDKRSRSKSRDRKRRSTSRHTRPLREMQDRKLFIGGLDPGTTTIGLRMFFEKFGTLTDVVVMKHRVTRRTRRFGFVTFESLSSSRKALEARPHKIDGMIVDTKEATPRGDGNDDGESEYAPSHRSDSRSRDREGRDRDRFSRDSRDRGRSIQIPHERSSERRHDDRRSTYDSRDSFEKDRIARERAQLRREREEIEREKYQLLRLQRDKLSKEREEKELMIILERQKLEQEREEFLRQQMRFGNNNQQWGNNNSNIGMKRPNDNQFFDFNKRAAFDRGGNPSFDNNERWGNNSNNNNNQWGNNQGRNLNTNFMGINFSNLLASSGLMQQQQQQPGNWRSSEEMMNNRGGGQNNMPGGFYS